MAAHRKSASNGDDRNSKNHEYMVHHFVYFLDCCKALLDNDQQGELPLMKELFAFRYPSTAKTSYPAGSFASWFVECHQSSELEVAVKDKENRKPRAVGTSKLGEQNPQTGQVRSGSRRHETEQYLGSGACRTSARKYPLQPNKLLFLEKRKKKDIGVERASQVNQIVQKSNVGRFGFKDSSLGSESFLNNHNRNPDDDEFSLQHWMNFGCIQARRVASPSRDVFELTNRAPRKPLLKKKKRLTLSKENKQSHQILHPSILNSYNDCFYAPGHHSPSFTHEGQVFVQQRHTSKGKKSELHEKSDHLRDFCQIPSAFSREHFRRSGTGKETWRSQNIPTSLSSTSQRTLSQGFLEGAKKSFLDDESIVSELPGNWCTEPYQRSTSKNQRKNLPDSSRSSFTCGLSDLSRRKYGPLRDSASECRQKVQNVKETEAEPLRTKELTSCMHNKTPCVEASEKHASVCAGKSASPDRLITETGLRHVQLRVQEEDGHPRNSGGGDKIAVSVERTRTLSQKYRPKVLKDLIGQNLVVHALSNVISNGKVAPVYLFQGPPGTGKTSAARIFAAALNCLTSGDKKPCGLCTECIAFVSSKTSGFWELDAASLNGIVYMKELIQGILSSTTGPRHKVIILDECHLFSHETWSALLKLLEEPPDNSVIVLITTHPGKLPLTVVSRCQKLHFLRIKHSDIVNWLDTVMKLEKLDAEPGVLNLIASRSEGSLRDAEIILDQVSLLEQRITLDTIHQLVGSASDDKLLSLLDVALRSDTLSTVQRTRELVDSGVEPLDLMFQLATLITNILAGSYMPMNTNQNEGCLSMHALSDMEMERLRTALRILSEAEKQLKATFQYRTTWLTAALLHVGPSLQSKSQASASSTTLIASRATESIFKNTKAGKKEVHEVKRGGRKRTVSMGGASEGKNYGFDAAGTNEFTRPGLESWVHSVDYSCLQKKPTLAALLPSFNEGTDLHVKRASDLERLWLNVLKCCRPLSLRQLLQDHGKLLAVSFSAVKVVAHLKIEKQDLELKAEFYKMCIVNSFKKLLGLPIEVEISLPLALCSAGSMCSSPASCDESVMQSTSKLCVGCEAFAPPVTNSIQPKLANKSSSNLSVLKQHFSGTEAAVPEQHSSESAFIYERKSPIQTAVDCCRQNLKVSYKSQIEMLKDRRRLRRNLRKSMAGLHTQKDSCYGIFTGLQDVDNTEAYKHKNENLVHEHQLKCGGLLCWKSQKSEAGKGMKHHKWKRHGISIRFRPWIKSQ